MIDDKLAAMKPRISYEHKEQLRLVSTLAAFVALSLFIAVIGVTQSQAALESCYISVD